MRRNRSMGRGGARGSLSLNMSGGPLLTEHLKDIDLELTLLKRKREMYEQQQQQLLQPFKQQQLQPPRNFNQQPYYRVQNEHGGDSNCDFSHLYNDGPQQYRKPFAKKRQSDNDWQHDSFPKRSSGVGPRGPSYAAPPPVRNQKPSYSAPNQQPKGFKYGQGKSFIGQKIANQKQQKPVNKNFVPNKITKPAKAAAPPTKLAAQPVAQRSELVAAAIKSVAEVESREREALRLLPDKEPTKQMTGRLELCLGAILRDIREKCAETPHEEVLRAATLQRVMKQAIRDRIRTAMLGKIVGSNVEIMKEYRTMFPKETDIDIVNKALEMACIAPEKPTNTSTIVPENEKPDEFFKENMSLLIEIHLKEMFDKLDEIYNPPEKEGEEDFTQDVEPTNDEATNQAKEVNPDEANKSVGEVAKNADPGEAQKSGEAITTANGTNAGMKRGIDELVAKLQNASPNDYKRLLPRLLKKYVPTILRLLHINKMYQRAVADLNTATRAKYIEYAKSTKNTNSEPEAVIDLSASDSPAPAPKFQSQAVLPYYVKVMGKHQLPKKKVMQAFLEIFHPKSIKKHRSIHNLLFIGFSEKSDYDAILQADGTVFGRSTLSIRACDKTAPKPEEKADVTAVSDANQSIDSNQDGSDIIGSELDGQITDLLTSIRNNETQKDNEEKAEGENQENNAESQEEQEGPSSVEVMENIDEIVKDETNENVEKTEANVETQKTPQKDEAKPEMETNGESKTETGESKTENGDGEAAKAENDQVAELKNTTGRSTPTRASSRLASTPATPSTIRTRRASRLIQ